MDEFITLIIFILPGLISFSLLKLFGSYPTVEQKNNGLVMLSAIMWIPINIIVLGIHALFAYFGKKYGIDIPYIYDFETLRSMSNNLFFVLYYSLFSIMVAYLLARIISKNIYNFFLSNVNKIRNKNGKASLSRDPTVWENTFTNDDAQIVKLKLGNEEYIGELQKVSSNIEKEKDLLLGHRSHWTEIMSAYEVDIEKVYIDTRLNLIIEIYDRDQCIIAQDLYLEEIQADE